MRSPPIVKSSLKIVLKEKFGVISGRLNITENPVTSPSGETLLTVDGEIVCVPRDFTE
jgi:hypothetical protein